MSTPTIPTISASPRLCSVDACDRRHDAKGFCKPHYRRMRRGVSVASPIGPAKMQPGAQHPNWRGDNVGYIGAHHRVYQARGSASQQACAHCGASARHWAYDHSDPNAKLAADGPYSVDVSRYIPLCGSCHNRFDFAHRTGR